MKELKIDKTMIINRLEYIEKYLSRLYELKKLSPGEFSDEKKMYFEAACYNLRNALEAVFDIGGHIVTREPGGFYKEYSDIAIRLGQMGVVPREFAGKNLVEMGKCRNKLTHLYLEITPKRICEILQNDLGDFEVFMKQVKKLMK